VNVWDGERLVPATPAPADRSVELSGLEAELAELGFATALGHYQQSHESFVDRRRAAANGQTRPFFEELCIRIAEAVAGRTYDSGYAALQALQATSFLDRDEHQMFKSFFQGIQDDGSHPGLSDEQEAAFRLHVSTAVARCMIHRLRARDRPLT
jgi:hypothetical protein